MIKIQTINKSTHFEDVITEEIDPDYVKKLKQIAIHLFEQQNICKKSNERL